MKKVLIIIFILAIILSACSKTENVDPKIDGLATCLTEKDVKFYGAFWCPHCKNQKDLFGNSIDKINYIECSTPDRRGQTQVCKNAGISGYPTWEFSDGTKLSGEQSLEVLAEKSGCTY